MSEVKFFRFKSKCQAKRIKEEMLLALCLVTVGNIGPPAATSATITIIQSRLKIVIDWEHWLLSEVTVCGLMLAIVNIKLHE